MGCHDGGGGGDPLFSCATKSLPHFLLSHSKEDVFIRLDTIWSFLQLTFFTMASIHGEGMVFNDVWYMYTVHTHAPFPASIVQSMC